MTADSAATVLGMGPDEERAEAFAHWYDEQVCTRIDPWRFGTRYLDEDFPDESDTNFLLIEEAPRTASPGAVVVAADAALGDTGSPRRVVMGSIALADRLSVPFDAAGWTLRRYLLLVRDPEAELPRSRIHAEEVSLTTFLRFRASIGAPSAPRGYLQKVERRVGSRYFVATIHGRAASGCVLWAHDGDAQIDAVITAPAMRGRGAGSAVMSAAIRAANARWLHLYSEAATGPLPFYKSLGFDIAGAIAEATMEDSLSSSVG
jgi:ribosomal protein S18 acetylase RimI-like enzyme